VKEDEMDRICSTHGEKMNAYRILVKKSQKERSHEEDLDVGIRIILKWTLEK
jgi:hypothetical protein